MFVASKLYPYCSTIWIVFCTFLGSLACFIKRSEVCSPKWLLIPLLKPTELEMKDLSVTRWVQIEPPGTSKYSTYASNGSYLSRLPAAIWTEKTCSTWRCRRPIELHSTIWEWDCLFIYMGLLSLSLLYYSWTRSRRFLRGMIPSLEAYATLDHLLLF